MPDPRIFIDAPAFHLIQTCHLIHGFSIQMHFSGVCRVGCDKPVTADQCRIWIVIPKQSVRNARCPHITPPNAPSYPQFRTGNPGFQFHRTVHNSCVSSRIRGSTYSRYTPGRYKHLVAGHCNLPPRKSSEMDIPSAHFRFAQHFHLHKSAFFAYLSLLHFS